MELHEIIQAKWIKDYMVELTFSNLRKGRVDFKKYLGKGIFKEFLKVEKFKRFKVDVELGTLCWPNGADIAPEVLYREVVSDKLSGRLSKAA